MVKSRDVFRWKCHVPVTRSLIWVFEMMKRFDVFRWKCDVLVTRSLIWDSEMMKSFDFHVIAVIRIWKMRKIAFCWLGAAVRRHGSPPAALLGVPSPKIKGYRFLADFFRKFASHSAEFR